MGYRSDVVLVIKSSIELPNTSYEGDDKGILDYANMECREDWSCFTWQSVKWYESYPKVKAIMDCLRGLEAKDYYFFILGEEFGDFEGLGSAMDHGECPFHVGPQQSIFVD